MGISNLSTGLRPGVCTSTTRPSTPFEGQMIYETDTNRVLVYEGAAWVMIADTDTPPGLELVKTQTIGSAVATVTVTNCFSSTYDSYKIKIVGVKGSVQAGLGLQLSSITSGYTYQGYYQLGGSGTMTGFFSSSATSFDIGATDTTYSMHDIDVAGANDATAKVFYATASGQGTTIIGVRTFGQQSSTTQSTGFTVSIASGTMTGGTIRVYGYRNAI